MSHLNAECPRCKDNAVDVAVSFTPGHTSGPPENCFPSEFEVTNVEGCSECGATEWTQEELDKIHTSAEERYDPSDDEPQPPDWEPEIETR